MTIRPKYIQYVKYVIVFFFFYNVTKQKKVAERLKMMRHKIKPL